jgi:hypothetical protein
MRHRTRVAKSGWLAQRPRRSHSVEDQVRGLPLLDVGNVLDTWGTVSPPSTPLGVAHVKESRSIQEERGDLGSGPGEELRSPALTAPPPSPFSPPPPLPLPPHALQTEHPRSPYGPRHSMQSRGTSPKWGFSGATAFSPRSPGGASAADCHVDDGTPTLRKGDVGGVLSRTNSGHSFASTWASVSTTASRSAYNATMMRFHSTAVAS